MKKRIVLTLACAALAALGVFGMAACNGGFDENRPIAVFGRDQGSGTRKAFQELLGLKDADIASKMVAQNGTAGLLTSVENNVQAIGYASLADTKDTVKLLKLNGYEATAENIRNNTYKLNRPFNIVQGKADSELTPLQADFKKFLLSGTAKTVMEADKLIAADGSSAYLAPAAQLSGKLVLWGSTSVQPVMNKLAAKYREFHPNVIFTVDGTGSGEGLQVGKGERDADFGMVSSEIEDGTVPHFFAIARDGIAVVVNKKNPLDNIATDQLRKVYTGEIAKWSEMK